MFVVIGIHNKNMRLNSSAKCNRIRFVSKKPLLIRSLGFFAGLTAIFFLQYPVLAQPLVLQNDDMIVACEPSLKGAAGDAGREGLSRGPRAERVGADRLADRVLLRQGHGGGQRNAEWQREEDAW